MGRIRSHNRATIICHECGAQFSVPHYRRNKAKFCGKSCSAASIARKHLNNGPKPWAAKNLDGHRHKSTSRFSAGHIPWNKGKKGIHLSPETEFQPGRKSDNACPLGTVTIRNDKNGKPRAWIKQEGGWMLRAHVVYIAKHGNIPDGTVVHHRDGDTLNDRPDNLKALTRAEHINEHRDDLKGAKNAANKPDLFIEPPAPPEPEQDSMDL